MVPALFFYQLVLVALVWLFLMLQWAWPSDRVTEQSAPPSPTPPRRKRRCEPKPHSIELRGDAPILSQSA